MLEGLKGKLIMPIERRAYPSNKKILLNRGIEVQLLPCKRVHVEIGLGDYHAYPLSTNFPMPVWIAGDSVVVFRNEVDIDN